MEERNKRVLVGMSGGIDSTATCLMLQEQGYEIVGVTMRVWGDEPQDARELAERMGIFQSNIAKIENGKDDVKMSTIENLAVALGESENVIFSAISNQRRKRKIKK